MYATCTRYADPATEHLQLNGAIYLEENLTEERKMDMARQENNPRSRKFAYHGYSFESWCTTAEPNLGPLWGGDVNTNEQWCHVVKTKLGNHRLVGDL